MSWDLTAEISRQRTDAANTFADTCVIARLSEVSDGQGGMTQAWTAVGTADCRIVANTGNLQQFSMRLNERILGDYTLTLSVDNDVREDDRVTVDAVTYRVIFADAVREWQTALRVQLAKDLT